MGERYFKILSVEWFRSQALEKQRAREFNSFSLSHERPFFTIIYLVQNPDIIKEEQMNCDTESKTKYKIETRTEIDSDNKPEIKARSDQK